MLAEMRAARLDLAARTPFARAREQIYESRAVYDEICEEPAEVAARATAASLDAASASGLIEMG